MRKLLTVAVLLTATALFAAAETAEDIVGRLQANQVFKTSRMQGVMTVTDRFGAKETRFISYARGENGNCSIRSQPTLGASKVSDRLRPSQARVSERAVVSARNTEASEAICFFVETSFSESFWSRL